MRIRDVFLLEAYYDDLQVAIMDRLTQYLGKEVNDIPTDEFRMALADDGFMLSFEEMKARKSSSIPSGAMGDPDDVGHLVTFLSSDYASYINSQFISVDGGLLGLLK